MFDSSLGTRVIKNKSKPLKCYPICRERLPHDKIDSDMAAHRTKSDPE
jgi:hypothetical protein